ncbi:tRNA pseudouridine(38-40) synthase TruA [Flavobacterium pallidum]|uniref:tRNA pseudouridine synthase A n=1 Tax=Flavobacterium pallidum TaxID=2172098 RepID=A0A2S1SJJ9_9FLAO|nr:tRNA pseudouridine(38-40) synthase TruA [Flavobacterium pallidum]AWI26565.1 tRNA pseudouridine(38-40) synthase TruA [Flavobacterium pallidum]
MRYFIEFSYNGTHYHGWQSQPNAMSVQEVLEKAMSVIFSQKIYLVAAGRTDTGVHAKKMYAHFDMGPLESIPVLVQKLNSYLPKDIAIADITKVHDDAHARFDAIKRTYEYHIFTKKNVFGNETGWHYELPLDVEAMNMAAAMLLDYTDFQCFSKVNTDVNTFNCKITEAYWHTENNALIFRISADRFLRNMVRAIVGTLVNIGRNKISVDSLKSIIESKDRSKAGFSVPAQGLFLTEIDYPYIADNNSQIPNSII